VILVFKLSSRFRWVFCQLETLRYCLPPSVRRTLDELPESLDETYERVLKEIKKPNREHARRLLQCLVAAIRPLRVSELAEVLAVDFDDEEGIPKLNPNWRWEDQEQALLSSCSSLIAIVESDESRIVQFSHFSVKEFLTSARLATSIGDISGYHIVLQPAHTVLAQACMSVLLRLDDRVEEGNVRNSSPLARYAAEHWVAHAQDEKVLSSLRKGMEYLFDREKPYFAAWLQLHDIDSISEFGSTFHEFTPYTKSGATPLYYAARNGFQDLVEHVVVNDPKQVNATGGYYVTPLVAALAAGHYQTAKFLHDKGAHPNVRGYQGVTPLHSAAYYGDFEMTQILLKYKAEVNSQNSAGRAALHYASQGRYHDVRGPNFALSLSNVARLLLEHGADVNAREVDHLTPLHVAARYGRIEVLRVLLEHGTSVGAADDDRKTAFHEHVNARDVEDKTPLHVVSESPDWNDPNFVPSLTNVARLLLEYGADVNARRNDLFTPLHVAARYGRVELARMLLEHGANVAAEDEDGKTASEYASEMGRKEITKLLLEHRAE
jgi:ankyrin repeat protein